MCLRIVAILCTLVLVAGSVGHADSSLIHLKYATFDPVAGEPSIPSNLRAAPPGKADERYIVQFVGPVQDVWKSQLESAGAVLEYIPDHAFAVLLTAEAAEKVRSLEFVRWVGLFHPAYRIDPDLLKEPGVVRADIAFIKGQASDRVRTEISRMGGNVEKSEDSPHGSHVRATGPKGLLTRLAALPEVAWIERHVDRKLHNNIARGVMNVPSVWSVAGLYGEGEIVAVCDTGLDTGSQATLSADFAGRVIATYDLGRKKKWDDPNGHGTHVAGSVLGAGVLSGSNPASHSYGSSFAGAAPEAQLVFQSVLDNAGGLGGIPANLNDLFLPPYNNGARTHTNSWGSAVSGTYTTDARNLDMFAWSHKDMMILAAAGNEGIDSDANGVIDMDSINSPGTAKNCITVGGSESYRLSGGAQGTYGTYWPSDYPANPIKDDRVSNNSYGIVAFSGRGPTNDGRIKPDVVAPGTNIISCRSHLSGAGTGWSVYNADYVYNGGTSMSTPLVAGTAALVRQYYRTQRGHVPSSALIKGTIINGATEMYPGQYGTGSYIEIPAARPNNVEGWGLVNPAYLITPSPTRVLEFVDHTTGLGTGGSASYSYYVAGSESPLRITLVWTDYPASTTASKSLVNDLDLVVTLPGGSVVRGNGTTDRTNNVEGVDIVNPVAGSYTVQVSGYNVPSGPQPFALVVSRQAVVLGPTAEITAPSAGTLLSGSVTVKGTASGPGFEHYVVEYGAGAAPSSWHPVGATQYTSVQNGVLGTWDTSGLPDGTYTLRLTVTGTGGAGAAQSTVQLVTTNIGSIKNNVDGTIVTLTGKTVSAIFANALYAQEPNRTSGIRVSLSSVPEEVVIGSTVTVTGTLATINGERVITNPTVTLTGNP